MTRVLSFEEWKARTNTPEVPIVNPETGENYRMPPVIPWEDWYADQENGPHAWKDDQHYTLIGTTGCGKTTLARELLNLRSYVVMLATKPRDVSLDRFVSDGYHVMREWKNLPIEDEPGLLTRKKGRPKRLVWPRLRDLNMDPLWQKYHIENAMDEMFTQGGWNIYLDEVRYISDELKLRRKLNLYLLQYRAMGGSLLAATQRPAWIPREFYSQSSHMCLWHQTDEYDLQRIAGIGALNPRFVRYLVARLEPHQFLYLHIPTGYMAISQAPNPDGR